MEVIVSYPPLKPTVNMKFNFATFVIPITTNKFNNSMEFTIFHLFKRALIILFLFFNTVIYAQWKKVQKYDGFGDPDGYYIENTFNGAKGSQLKLELHKYSWGGIDIKFKFIVNGELLTDIPKSLGNERLIIKDEKGYKHYGYLAISKEGDHLYVVRDDFGPYKFAELLRDNDSIKVLIGEDTSTGTNFVYSIECQTAHNYFDDIYIPN